MIDTKLFNWSKVYWIDIKDIKYGSGDVVVLTKDWGENFGSIWDKNMTKIIINHKDTAIMESMRQFLIEGIPLNQTKEYTNGRYKKIVSDLKNGNDKYHYGTEKNFIKVLENRWKNLYNSVKKYGLKSQKELIRLNIGYTYTVNANDEIAAIIDQDGTLIFFNGGHRIACAIILGIKQIPIRIAVRHKKWVDFMLSVYEFNKKCWRGKNKTYQTIDHVDFRDFVPEWSPTYRYNKIKENLNITSGSLLDIGALWGDFCQKFESDGFDCTAVERDSNMVRIMEKMKIAKEKKFNIILDDVFNLNDYNYDVVLALNIFHHFLKTEELHEKLRLMIQKIKCKEFYVQTHNFQGNIYQNLYRNYKPEEFIGFILQNNNYLNSYKEIGEERGRKLFKLFTK